MMVAAPARADQGAEDGAALYESACAACHGSDGRGAPRSVVGFAAALPDFTDCQFTTSEADADWSAVVQRGGPARGLDRTMPAFGDALSSEQIQRAIDFIRGFCASRAWPHGNLNVPRALVTAKAFPENEVATRTVVPAINPNFVETRAVYERRIGPGGEYEIAVPLNFAHGFGHWNGGLGDIEVGFKQVIAHSRAHGSIVSAGSAITFPTGNETKGLGRHLRVLEPFGSLGQTLASNIFVQAQFGFEVPLNIATANNEVFWRAAVGKTIVEPNGGRAWSPMVEILGARELEFGARGRWDLVPELQVTLSRRQHISASGGVRVPLNLRAGRPSTVLIQLLWDWYNGSMLAGW
jgi:hypothetical protein